MSTQGWGPPHTLARSLLSLSPFGTGMAAMRGIITSRDVVRNVGTIYREFGGRCLLRCLWVMVSGRRTTFLELAFDCARRGASGPR